MPLVANLNISKHLAHDFSRGRKWCWVGKENLLKSEIQEVINAIKCLSKANATEVNKVLTYIENHKDQMNYRYYRSQGWMIGSGSIESAHRTVRQVRMKRSGQRWANNGCDSMVKLRIAYKNNRRDLIQNLLKNTA